LRASEERSDSQALDDTESADAKVISKNGEKPVEEDRGPADFGQEEDGDLSDDQKAIEDSPEDAGRLVGNGRVTVNRVSGDTHGAWRETYGT
jgi:hypothetical protein